MKKVVFISIGVCSILLFCLTGCAKQEPKDIHNKLDSELEYVEDLIFKIANKHAKGEYLEDDEIKWEYIKGDIGKINDSWSTLVLDLTEVNVQNQIIMGFSTDLSELLIAVSNENDKNLLEELSQMYEKIIQFKEAYSQDKNKIEKNKIKSQVLSIYTLINKKDWMAASTEVDTVVENYKGLMNDIKYAEENAYNLNKIYILLEEYKASIQTQNYDLIRMKYINAVENL